MDECIYGTCFSNQSHFRHSLHFFHSFVRLSRFSISILNVWKSTRMGPRKKNTDLFTSCLLLSLLLLSQCSEHWIAVCLSLARSDTEVIFNFTAQHVDLKRNKYSKQKQRSITKVCFKMQHQLISFVIRCINVPNDWKLIY